MRFSPILVGLSLAVAWPPNPCRGATANRIAAIVNNEVITVGEVQERAKHETALLERRVSGPERKRQVQDLMRFWLKVMIRRRLLTQAAKEVVEKNPAAKKVLDKAVKDEVKRLTKLMKEMAKADGKDEEAGLSWDERTAVIRDDIMVEMYLHNVVYAKISVSPKEMRDYYRKNIKQFSSRKRAKIRRIVIRYGRYRDIEAARQQAQKVMEEIKAGKDFAELVRRYSNGPRAKTDDPDKAGLFGFDEVHSLKELRDQALAMEAGEVSDVVPIADGLVIFKAEEVRPASQMSFEMAQNEIREILMSRGRGERFKEVVRGLEEKAMVKRVLPQ